MIQKKKVIALGVSRYVGLPRDFNIKPGEKLVLIHNKLIGFATPEIGNMTDEAFRAELSAVSRMLVDTRRILALEASQRS
jgi:hypothetical protein